MAPVADHQNSVRLRCRRFGSFGPRLASRAVLLLTAFSFGCSHFLKPPPPTPPLTPRHTPVHRHTPVPRRSPTPRPSPTPQPATPTPPAPSPAPATPPAHFTSDAAGNQLQTLAATLAGLAKIRAWMDAHGLKNVAVEMFIRADNYSAQRQQAAAALKP